MRDVCSEKKKQLSIPWWMQKEGKLVWMRAVLIYSFSFHQILHEVGFQEK